VKPIHRYLLQGAGLFPVRAQPAKVVAGMRRLNLICAMEIAA
jgi:hypothetical protein